MTDVMLVMLKIYKGKNLIPLKLNRSKQTNQRNRRFSRQSFWWKTKDPRLALVSSSTKTLAKLPVLQV